VPNCIIKHSSLREVKVQVAPLKVIKSFLSVVRECSERRGIIKYATELEVRKLRSVS
jgi:hypothetical protein